MKARAFVPHILNGFFNTRNDFLIPFAQIHFLTSIAQPNFIFSFSSFVQLFCYHFYSSRAMKTSINAMMLILIVFHSQCCDTEFGYIYIKTHLKSNWRDIFYHIFSPFPRFFAFFKLKRAGKLNNGNKRTQQVTTIER